MTKFTDEKIQQLANTLVEVSVNLRRDPTEASQYADRLRSVLNEVEKLGGEQLSNMQRAGIV